MSTRDTLLGRFLVTPGEAARIADRDPASPGDPELADLAQDELAERAKDAIARGIAELSEAQELLWATDRYALLVVLQAMDAAGKDSVIKHVMSGLNPQGVQVVSFRQPSSEELDHDFLWRISKALPERGRIGIFNRSHYEEVVALKVHPEWLEPQRLPPGDRGEEFWQERYEDINAFERHLDRQRDEGREVLPARLEGGAEEALPRAPRRARQGVEVQRGRRRRAGAVRRLHQRIRGRADRDVHPVGAVVRHPRRPLVADAGAGRVGTR
jgi:Polyphosphate kinase 2 (PPK2)